MRQVSKRRFGENMWNKWLACTWSLVLGLCVAIPQRAAAQGTSTPEERARWAEITHKLESNPLDESVNKDGEAALNRLGNAHDIHVPLCPALLAACGGSQNCGYVT